MFLLSFRELRRGSFWCLRRFVRPKRLEFGRFLGGDGKGIRRWRRTRRRRGRVGAFGKCSRGLEQLILCFCSELFWGDTSQSVKLFGKELVHHSHLLAHQALDSGFRCAAFVI